MIIELMIRLAKFLYATDPSLIKTDKDVESSDDEGLEAKPRKIHKEDAINCSKAFEMFNDKILQPYIEKSHINWSEFREKHLHDPSVELVYTMNMPAIEAIYHKYS